MITDAVDAENLADEIEAQTKEDSLNTEAADVLKKNSESCKEKLSAEETIKQETAKINAQEIKETSADIKAVSPVAEPEMIKETLPMNNKEEQSESAPAEQAHKEDAAEFKEKHCA